MGMDRLPGLSLAINTGRPPYPILGDPGAVSRAALQLHADLSVYFRNGHNRWILYLEGSIYSSGLSLRECSF